MHETVMAQQIVQAVLAEVDRRSASGVRSIDVELGQLEGLREETLRRAFRAEAIGTVLEETDLHVTVAPAVAFCPACNAPKAFDFVPPAEHGIPKASCPDCGADLEFRGGRGLIVRRATMVLEDP
ncbi:MAG TPA: hydrogenase/urease maturation nickel metallochaperone HypA [Thermoplasmata archaeon]